MAIQSFATRDDAAEAAADFITRALQAGLDQRGAACAALSGGSSPKAAYELLAARPLNWAQITFLQVDERCVPISNENLDAPGLNAGMLRQSLEAALRRGARLSPLWISNQTPDQAAAKANALYQAFDIDAALLGMGTDGHTASWFPTSPDLSRAIDPHTQARVIAIDAPGAEVANDRLTLTLSGLSGVKQLALLIYGDDKRVRLRQALKHETQQSAPVLALLNARPDCAILWAP